MSRVTNQTVSWCKVQPGIIQVGPVEDQQITRLKAQVLHGLEVMGLAIGDQDALGKQPGKHSVQLNSPLRVPSSAQGKTGAQVDGGGIDV